MDPIDELLSEMPDVAMRELDTPQSPLDWVGMSGVPIPLQIQDGDQVRCCTAECDVFADLADPLSKGIHMSRLFLALDRIQEDGPLKPQDLPSLLNSLLASQEGLSTSVALTFRFDLLIRRPALESEHSGWRRHPASIRGSLQGGEVRIELTARVLYSSTCPCSAALARQLVQEKFAADFCDQESVPVETIADWLSTPEGIVATPHGQRSVAALRVRVRPDLSRFPFTQLIDRAEEALGTPVQAAVKREDEKAFALLNGKNPMFCEDAARRLQCSLDGEAEFTDYMIRVEHQESLHAHNAIAVVSKKVPWGFKSMAE